MYECEKEKLKLMLSKLPGRINLTLDVWTSYTMEGYISLIAHYVDQNWKLHSKMLNFSHFPPPHFGREMAKIIYDFLEDWGIKRKIFSLTLDNSSSNDKIQDYLKERLLLQNNGLLCGGEFFYIRCVAHILNLIVQEGLKFVGQDIHKIKESIKYVKGSKGRIRSFKACIAKIGGMNTKMGLHLDVVTRWNSTFLMLESALSYQRAFTSLAFEDRSYLNCPTNEEWDKRRKNPFYQITELLYGSSYPTYNLYFIQVWKIECLLIKNVSNENGMIRVMASEMRGKFGKYWSEYSIVLSFGCILDPHFKFEFFKFCYSKIGLDPMACQAKLKVVKHKLKRSNFRKDTTSYSMKDYKEKEKEKPKEKSSSDTRTSSIKCFKCLGRVHIASQCPTKKTMILKGNEILSEDSTTSSSSSFSDEKMKFYVNDDERKIEKKEGLRVGGGVSSKKVVPRSQFSIKHSIKHIIVMHFGLTNTPRTFMRLMNHVLRYCIGRFVVVYFDDILINSKSLNERIGHLKKVLIILRDNHLCQLRKIYFLSRKCKLFGIYSW
uniref:AC transposase n=1 Tax=Cajanus cajan TaxID=3821 RepID=A0A151SYC8_CAJCA|nr:Putative AC transposase [Cajanus cajan]